MLWELWRLTRAEIALKLVLPIGGALTVLLLATVFGPQDNPTRYEGINDFAAAVALIVIVMPHLVGWISLAKLNGGQPGFPLYLSFTRPVRTAVLVALPMAYLIAVSLATYLASAMVLRIVSGYAFPLLPVAAWVAALTVIALAATWATRSRAIQMVVTMCATAQAFLWAMQRLTAVEIPGEYDWPPRLWPTLFDWPLTDYAWVALIGLASFGVTVAMVARQRRGDALSFTWSAMGLPRAASRGLSSAQSRGLLSDSLVGRFRIPCPTSSATWAQLWFDLKSTGLPVLRIGVLLALVILLLSAVSGRVDAALNSDDMRARLSCSLSDCFYLRTGPVMFTPLSLFAVLVLGGNAFGIRRRQGRAYLSAFEATQTYGTAQLAVLKLLVKSICVLVALTAIVVSAWISLAMLGDPVFLQMFDVPLSSHRSAITGAVAALSGYEQLALAVVAVVGIGVWVASWAAVGAVRTRYRRPVSIASFLLLVYGLALVWLAVGVRVHPETARQLHLDVVYAAMRWVVIAAIVCSTVYVFWSGFAEHVLTIRYAGGAVAVSAAFAAAWLTALHAAGVQLGGMSATSTIAVVTPALLPLMASGLVPWSYSRIRHT
jgi:hypothetical protein